METQERICKFCLKVCDSFKYPKEHMKDILDKLVPKIKLVAVQKSLMCTHCAEIFIKCLNFKAAYLDTYNYNKDSIKLELKDVYLSKNENNTDTSRYQDSCRFCIGSIKYQFAVPLNVEIGDVALDKITECLPELDLNISKKPVICLSCRASLKYYFRFVIDCVEEKIKKYCETVEIGSEGEIEISNSRYLTMSELDGNFFDKIKVEKQCEERENDDESEIANRPDDPDVSKLERSSWDGTENVTGEVEHKHYSYLGMDDLKLNSEEQFALKNMLDYKVKSKSADIKVEEILYGGNGLKQESFIEMEDHKFLHNEEIEIKPDEEDFNRFRELEAATKSHSKQTYLKANPKDDLSTPYIKQKLENKKSSTVVIMYQCRSCSFQTKYKGSLSKHLLSHKSSLEVKMYNCDFCSFQTRYNGDHKRHMLVHKNPSEVTMYKCDSCSFETKYMSYLKRHSLIHRNPSDVTMYKCDSCSYQTKYGSNFKIHSLMHMNPSEVTMYKCDSCSFQAKRKKDLKVHSLLHKNASEVRMYKCDTCLFETKYGSYLKRHSLIHRNPSDVTMYKCDSCSYQTRYGSNLKMHSLQHMNPSEITMYKCDSCPFQTKRKYNLMEHSLQHKDPSELTMYKCDSCSFETKNGSYLKRHSLKHRNPSDITMYKCDSCSYQTKYGSNLKMHSLMHMNPSEVTMYKCDSCSFQAKRKKDLKIHSLLHKNASEVTMYKCDSCPYHTKFKGDLKKHIMRVHKIPQK